MIPRRLPEVSSLFRWVAVAALGIGSAAAVAKVGADHVLPLQVVAAGAGAVLTVGGAAVVAHGWPQRRASEWRGFVVSTGFFCASIGVFATAMGIGVFH